MSDFVSLEKCTWKHGMTKNGQATFINARDENDESVLVAIVSSDLSIDLREDIAQKICALLSEDYSA